MPAVQTLLVLAPGHLDDSLFLRLLGRRLAGPASWPRPLFITHGSGERVERVLESAGYDAVRAAGVWQVSGPAERSLVERGIRESNRRVTAALTEEGVPAVSLQGCDRRVFRHDDSGNVTAVLDEALLRMADAGAVPVISLLRAGEEVEEMSLLQAIPPLCRALAARAPLRIVFLSTGGAAGVRVETQAEARAVVSSEAVARAVDPETAPVVRALTEAGFAVTVAGVSGLGDAVRGSEILRQPRKPES